MDENYVMMIGRSAVIHLGEKLLMVWLWKCINVQRYYIIHQCHISTYRINAWMEQTNHIKSIRVAHF